MIRSLRGRSLRRGLLTALFIFVAFNPALAEVRIKASLGGVVTDYLRFFDALRHSGQRIVIDGPCYSSCTLVLSTIPNDRICITRRAVLAFHAPRRLDQDGRDHPAPDAVTRLMTAAYPAPIRDWINRRGGLTGKPIFLRAPQLAALYPLCR
jgi:hypothetical protein